MWTPDIWVTEWSSRWTRSNGGETRLSLSNTRTYEQHTHIYTHTAGKWSQSSAVGGWKCNVAEHGPGTRTLDWSTTESKCTSVCVQVTFLMYMCNTICGRVRIGSDSVMSALPWAQFGLIQLLLHSLTQISGVHTCCCVAAPHAWQAARQTGWQKVRIQTNTYRFEVFSVSIMLKCDIWSILDESGFQNQLPKLQNYLDRFFCRTDER